MDNCKTEKELDYENFVKYSYTAIAKLEFREPMPIDLPVSEQINWCLKFLYIAECNDEFAGGYGFSCSKDLVGLPLRSCWGDAKNAREILKMLIESNYTWKNIETHEITKDGEELYALNNINSTIKNHKVYKLWVMAIDITELKITQHKLKTHQKKLEILVEERTKELESTIHKLKSTNNELQKEITARKKIEIALKESETEQKVLNATKDKFFFIIAHDLRNPFHSIIALSQILIHDIHDKEHDEIEKTINLIHDVSSKSYKLLENLLQWALAQKGEITFKPEHFNLLDLFNSEIDFLFNLALQKNISLSLSIKPDLEVFADKNMIVTIVINLVSNAIKFTHHGGAITVVARANIDETKISVIDTGMGMKPKDVEKLFKIENAQSTRGTDNEKGTGLGLILCKEFTEKHNGKIWVESEVGKGSLFNFTIPTV